MLCAAEGMIFCIFMQRRLREFDTGLHPIGAILPPNCQSKRGANRCPQGRAFNTQPGSVKPLTRAFSPPPTTKQTSRASASRLRAIPVSQERSSPSQGSTHFVLSTACASGYQTLLHEGRFYKLQCLGHASNPSPYLGAGVSIALFLRTPGYLTLCSKDETHT